MGGTHYREVVSKCPHCQKEVQPWDFFGMMPFLVGCAMKYLTRYKGKGGKEDLLKAIHYIQKLIEVEYPD